MHKKPISNIALKVNRRQEDVEEEEEAVDANLFFLRVNCTPRDFSLFFIVFPVIYYPTVS